MESEDLQRVYSLLTAEITKAQHKIDVIDRTIDRCDRLSHDYWCDVRAEAVAYLNGIHRALIIVRGQLHR